MNHTDSKILSLSTALLLCIATLTLAAPPDGKGKPPKGNQPVAATAIFLEEILSSPPELQGELIDNGGFDTLDGQLAGGETITVMGDAGEALVVLEDRLENFLPAQGVLLPLVGGMVTFNADSGVSWTIRLDRDKEPSPRVQFKMRWVNEDGFERHLRIGWVVQFLSGEELTIDDYGEVTNESASLEEAVIAFASDPFRIDGDVKVDGRGKKKTELVVFSRYGEEYSADTPWCRTDTDPPTCRESTMIQTARTN